MSSAQIYCSIQELVTDLKLIGDEPQLMQRIREASQFMVRNLGRFIPATETRKLAGVSVETLDLGSPLLTISAVRVDGIAMTDYVPWPHARCWENGPYTWLTRSAGWGTTVEIDGVWGLYDDRHDLGITATQAVGAGTLVVSDGSLISPGMVLLIGSEQELVTAGNGGDRSPAATEAVSVLTVGVDNASEEIPVSNGAEFHLNEVIQIGTEDLFIRKIGGNALICSRGWNGTTKAAHLANAAIGVYRTFTVQRYLPPADVHWLALQIAALMRQKAMTAFGGRAGNADLGETFYINEFPRQIADVRANYSIPYL